MDLLESLVERSVQNHIDSIHKLPDHNKNKIQPKASPECLSLLRDWKGLVVNLTNVLSAPPRATLEQMDPLEEMDQLESR